MTIRAAHSTQADPALAAGELKSAVGDVDPVLVLFFASSRYEPGAIAAAVHEAFGSRCRTLGCTTAGELAQNAMFKGGIAALAMDASSLRSTTIAIIDDPGNPQRAREALRAVAAGAGAADPTSLDPARHLGLVLQDGMSGTEESLMDVLSTGTNVPFVGGSAGDDGDFEVTHIFLDGAAHASASALALLEPTGPFEILKTQSFDVGETTLTVTRADEANRTVLEFDGEPALAAYARTVGVSPDELPDHFMKHPLGLVLASGEPFVRSPQQVQGSSVVFYCQIKEGMRLHLLTSRNIVDDTRRDLHQALRQIGGCAAILNFHCILRTLELEANDQCESYAGVFADIPTAGFSTYGESYVGHINQTSTMVLFR